MNAIKRDLLERRSWPIVALLVVAVVAVPLLFVKQGSANGTRISEPPAITGSSPSTQSGASQAGVGLLAARERDPFTVVQPSATASSPSGSEGGTASPGATGSPSNSGGSSSAGSGSDGTAGGGVSSSSGGSSTTSSTTTSTSTSTSTTSTTTGNPPAPPKPKPPGLTATESYRVSLAITNPSGGLNTIDPLERLSVLPSRRQPLLVELGVLQGGRRVLFVVQPGTVVSGPGTCAPGPIDCQILSLAPNQTERLATRSSAGVNPVALFSVNSIKKDRHRTASAADKSRRAASAVGQRLLKAAPLSAISLFQYRPAIGAVVDLRTISVGGSI